MARQDVRQKDLVGSVKGLAVVALIGVALNYVGFYFWTRSFAVGAASFVAAWAASPLAWAATLCITAMLAVRLNDTGQKGWRFSADGKVLLALFLALGALQVAGEWLPLALSAKSRLSLLSVPLILAAVAYWVVVRVRRGWKRPPLTAGHVFCGIVCAVLLLVEFWFWPRDATFAEDGNMLALSAILPLYALAYSLRLVTLNEVEFRAQLHRPEETDADGEAS